MTARVRHGLLYAAALILAVPAILVFVGELRPFGWEISRPAMLTAAGLALLFGLPVAALAVSEMRGVLRSLERLRGLVVMVQTDEADAMPGLAADELPPETRRLFDAIESLIAGRLAEQALPVRQLEAILSALPDAIVVINHAGQVGLVNGPARQLLGSDAAAVGTSIFDALSSTSVMAALDQAIAAGGAAEAALPAIDGRTLEARVVAVDDGRGAILLFHSAEADADQAMDHDLALLDVPPEPQPFTERTPLADLPIFVFDLETTGLDVESDAILAIGGLRMHGATIYRAATLDRLVNPGQPIPAHATAVHGISDEMVADAAPFAEVWPELLALMRGTVLVGHNVGFDIAHLVRATREAGIEWRPPPYLCTYLLAGALYEARRPPALDTLARECGVRVRGKHTALGDSLVTAEVFARLLQRLDDLGIETLGDAIAFAGRRTDLIGRQRKLGWWIGENH